MERVDLVTNSETKIFPNEDELPIQIQQSVLYHFDFYPAVP